MFEPAYIQLKTTIELEASVFLLGVGSGIAIVVNEECWSALFERSESTGSKKETSPADGDGEKEKVRRIRLLDGHNGTGAYV